MNYERVKFKHRHYDYYYKCYSSVNPDGKVVYIHCQPWFDDKEITCMKIEIKNGDMFLKKNE